MSDPTQSYRILCITSAIKGQALLRELKRQGCTVILLTEDRWRDSPEWPYESVDHMVYMPSLYRKQEVMNQIGYMLRGWRIDAIIPLDDYEVEMAASLREHLRMKGMGETAARFFRDKLAMRVCAQEANIPVPEFTSVFNYDKLRAFMAHVPAPWLLKPRSEAGSMGIKKCENDEQVWRLLDELGDNQSNYLLEQFVPSDVFHVDSIVWQGEIVFSAANAYGKPPLTVSHGGGVFTTRILPEDDAQTQSLKAMNARVLQTLGLTNGVAHAEYLRGVQDGQLRFLECAARVGGANISDMIEHGTGINPWAEWARIELAQLRGEDYTLPITRKDYSGILVCLSRYEWSDLSSYDDPEVKWVMRKAWHAGVIVVSPESSRVQNLLNQYAERFANDFVARGEVLETGRVG
jgi:carbamoylphosphate synthase large subunit